MPYLREITIDELNILELNQIPHVRLCRYNVESVAIPREHLYKALYLLNRFVYDDEPNWKPAS